jgi:hypothetical protein
MRAYLSTLTTLLQVLAVYNLRMTLVAIGIALPVACVFAAAPACRPFWTPRPPVRRRRRTR